ncbi:MAG: DNA-3-methyladenine glycosylase [Bacilli bacterium]|nr:DNA-3-methyladenine glycosylase [Bacilli bacterium]
MRIQKKDMLDFSFDERSGTITLSTPAEFSFAETLKYLSRSTEECLHQVEENKIYKLFEIERETVLIEISENSTSSIQIRFADITPHSPSIYKGTVNLVLEWFDFNRDLAPFYNMANDDPLLSRLTSDYFGLRIVGIQDLFEALCWAVIGQQINLKFAYTLKKRFVETFGKHVEWNGKTYWLFPQPRQMIGVVVNDLKNLQFTGKKAEYLLGIAKLIESGTLSKQALLATGDFKAAEQQLLAIRGIGPWTAHYVLMRCLRDPSAFPIGDAGLQNALRQQLNRAQKPSEQEIRQLFSSWRDWEAYAVFYLWRSLES